MPRHNRKWWAIAVGIVVCWLVLLNVTGSVFWATVVLALLAALGVAAQRGLRALGFPEDHPWLRRAAPAPPASLWYGGEDVPIRYDPPAPAPVYPDDQTQLVPPPVLHREMPTVMERSYDPGPPLLRLITGDSVAETRQPGARAGRGEVELGLPNVPTVSREHARFTFAGGQWRIANLGMNGLTVNGRAVADGYPLGDGDLIRWGTRPDALLSRVEIS